MLILQKLIELLAEPLFFRAPAAKAELQGSKDYPDLRGEVLFYRIAGGTLVAANVDGLPQPEACGSGFFGFHIHEGGSCTGNEQDPFADAGSHFNPGGCPHPGHAGDLPPLMADRGHACLAVATGRFTVGDIVGKTVIIHEKPDDLTSQPSGNAGKKLACGVIQRL